MLKPIPQEQQATKRSVIIAMRRNKQKAPQLVHLEMTIQKLQKTDGKLFTTAARQLMEFIKKAENVSANELNELIHNLQRTVLGLQKKRIQSVRMQQRKKKK